MLGENYFNVYFPHTSTHFAYIVVTMKKSLRCHLRLYTKQKKKKTSRMHYKYGVCKKKVCKEGMREERITQVKSDNNANINVVSELCRALVFYFPSFPILFDIIIVAILTHQKG